jgi:site-specific DNA-methyltransferase (adenine-specific)
MQITGFKDKHEYVNHNGTKSVLYLMDCMEALKQIPDKYYELAIVDPPYGIGYDGAKQTSGSHGGRKGHKFKGWDTKTPCKEYFDFLFNVSENQIIWGANYFTIYLPRSMGWVIWRKDRGDFSSSDAELAFTSFDRALREWTKNPLILVREGGTIHPTQKPVALYSWLLQNYAKQGDKILDTHCGSGSSRIACDKLDFDFTGFEIDSDYFYASVKRFENFVSQLRIF